MSDIIIQIVFASGNTHYTISSRAFLKKIKRVAALILSVCRNVFASVSSAVEALGKFLPARREAACFPASPRQKPAVPRTRESVQKHKPSSITGDVDEILWVPFTFYKPKNFFRDQFASDDRVGHFIVFPAERFKMMVAAFRKLLPVKNFWWNSCLENGYLLCLFADVLVPVST